MKKFLTCSLFVIFVTACYGQSGVNFSPINGGGDGSATNVVLTGDVTKSSGSTATTLQNTVNSSNVVNTVLSGLTVDTNILFIKSNPDLGFTSMSWSSSGYWQGGNYRMYPNGVFSNTAAGLIQYTNKAQIPVGRGFVYQFGSGQSIWTTYKGIPWEVLYTNDVSSASGSVTNLPTTSNILAGNGSGGAVDSGVAPSEVVTNGGAASLTLLTVGDYDIDNLNGFSSANSGGQIRDSLDLTKIWATGAHLLVDNLDLNGLMNGYGNSISNIDNFYYNGSIYGPTNKPTTITWIDHNTNAFVAYDGTNFNAPVMTINTVSNIHYVASTTFSNILTGYMLGTNNGVPVMWAVSTNIITY